MEANYYLNRIDSINKINVADTLITPLRWLVNGKRYIAVRVEDEFSHPVIYEKSSPFINVIKRIIGFIGTIALFPLVCLGIAIKKYQISDITQENYASIQSLTLDNKAKILFKKAFSIAPKPIPKLPHDAPSVLGTDLSELSVLWTEAGKDHTQRDEFSNKLNDWITHVVPDPSKYNYISQETAPNAAKELEYYLKLLILELKARNDSNTSERVIIELINASGKCSPTWLEVAKREYQKLKCGDLVDQQILQYLREVKEDLIMEFAERTEEGSQWHVINYARWIVGKEFGLDRSQLDFDSVIEQKEMEGYSKDTCRKIFYSIFKLDEIIPRIQAKIELEHSGGNTSIQFYGPALSKIANAHAAAAGVDVESEEYDDITYSTETFFDLKGSTYVLNNNGVEAFLKSIGLFQ